MSNKLEEKSNYYIFGNSFFNLNLNLSNYEINFIFISLIFGHNNANYKIDNSFMSFLAKLISARNCLSGC